MITKYTMHDFNSLIFVEVCFMTQDMDYFGECSMQIWKECVYCSSQVKGSININQNQLVDVVQFFYILVHFWSIFSINVLSITEKGELKSLNCGFVCLCSCQCLHFVRVCFEALLASKYIFEVVLSSYIMPHFISVIFLALKSIVSK